MKNDSLRLIELHPLNWIHCIGPIELDPVGVYNGNLQWESTMGIYNGNLPWESTMGVCNGNLQWGQPNLHLDLH